eukprot:1286269-Ditylum_brightwellii.AAC.1
MASSLISIGPTLVIGTSKLRWRAMYMICGMTLSSRMQTIVKGTSDDTIFLGNQLQIQKEIEFLHDDDDQME